MRSYLKVFIPIIASAVTLGTCWTANAATSLEARQAAWRTAIAHTAAPSEGCFTAKYPLLVWHEIRCAKPSQAQLAHMQRTATGRAVTGGDYAAVTKKLTSAAVGSFPAVKHLTSETSMLGANDYSLQLNTNFIANENMCAGEGVAGACSGWQQFVFDNLYNSYIQYWLVFYNATCPSGWNAGPLGGCWKNSALLPVPAQDITELPHMSLSGAAVEKGHDTLVVTTRTQAYSLVAKDSVLDLARAWHATDFNVFGDSTTPATFNPGASLTDRVDLTTSTTTKPKCLAFGGHSGETTNLVDGPCRTFAGAVPAMQFVETAPK